MPQIQPSSPTQPDNTGSGANTDRYRGLRRGPAAPLGQLDYVIGGVMIGGFALVAAAAKYRATGVKTFMDSYDGVVYQKDLEPDTPKVFQSMKWYNPDKCWQPTDDQWPSATIVAGDPAKTASAQ
jgi:Protein of unknown function (DUF2950)